MSTAAQTRILFVDDDQAILDLLEMAVEMMNGHWQTQFVNSGEKALAQMARQSFDLVVSDMRMPGMTGAVLLNEVMRLYPATSRIILSGYADREDVWRCVGATHQFLSKPFEIGTIATMLNRMQGLRERLPSREIQQMLARKNTLPSIPAVYFELVAAVQDPDCPTERIAEIVASDPALSAKILQLVNSAFFGVARQVSSICEAVMFLGVGTLRSLAMTRDLFAALGSRETSCWSPDRVCRHCLRVGQWAKQLVTLEHGDSGMAEQAFTAGLLHDLGKLILAENSADTYLELLNRAQQEERPLVDLEREVMGSTHADVGAYVLDLWGLPSPLVEAVAFHHDPSRNHDENFSPLTAVHAANVLENASQSADPQRELAQIDHAYLRKIGRSDRLEAWSRKVMAT